MKEKIIEILKSSLRTFAYIDPVTGERRTAQESAIPEDQFPKIAAEQLEPLINQEVERRIAERMPSEKAITREADLLYSKEIFIVACEWLRSRLTCSEKPNNSQKTEGGNQ